MKIGFIGAGNVGCSLGRYLQHNHVEVAGYYSRTKESAIQAAKITNTAKFDTLQEIVDMCDTLFLTVSDGAIPEVWNQIKDFSLEGKIICHCSGAISASVFSEIHEKKAYGYSIHPMFPFNNKQIPYEVMQQVFITIEGSHEKIQEMKELFQGFGNCVKIIDGTQKVNYHAASVMASNAVVGLLEMAIGLLKKCQFEEEEARDAIKALAIHNMEHVLEAGTMNALTGPVERNDVETVKRHLSHLDEEQQAVYRACSNMLLHITARKYPERNEDELKRIIRGEGK